MGKITKLLGAASAFAMTAMTAMPAWAQCNPNTAGCNEVPELNASAGLAAVAVLVTVVLIVREMIVRRRAA